MIYLTDRHTPLKDLPWDENAAMEFASDVMDEANRTFRPEALWPAHPLDQESPDDGAFTDLYFGALGNAVAFDLWARRTGERFSVSPREISKIAERTWLSQQGDGRHSYFFGETGYRLIHEFMDPRTENRDTIRAAIRALMNTEWNELLYGSPGGLIAAQFLWEGTAEEETELLIRELVTNLFEKWTWRDEIFAHAWEQDFGTRRVYLGAAHGTAGNIRALLKASEHLTEEENEALLTQAIEFVKKTATVEGGFANWRPMLDPASSEKPLLHWCHGAPGFLTSLATEIPVGRDGEFDDLMLKGGELIWHAGPLAKGPSLCHGTAGNAAALLKLYRRTDDEKWLDRARRLAMNAIEQSREHREKYGQWRYSLWTGDLGVALLIDDCIRGESILPGIDSL